MSVIIRKLRKQDRRGNVWYKLTAEGREYKSVYFEKRGEEIAHRLDPRHVSREYEEEHEGEKQSVIHVRQSFSVHNQEDQRNENETYQIMNSPEHN